MSLSVLKNRSAPVWPLGFIGVVTPGVPVSIMSLVDPSNNNAPGTATGPNVDEYPWTAIAISFQCYKPGAGNNGMVPCTGPVYLLTNPSSGGSGNRSDSGCMLKVFQPTGDYAYPTGVSGLVFSPYNLFIDADNAGDGVLALLYGGQGR